MPAGALVGAGVGAGTDTGRATGRAELVVGFELGAMGVVGGREHPVPMTPTNPQRRQLMPSFSRTIRAYGEPVACDSIEVGRCEGTAAGGRGVVSIVVPCEKRDYSGAPAVAENPPVVVGIEFDNPL